ncbi:MAG: hypothetical protein IPP81_09780 [Chitinophagaceae bacterium]|nr:hypothetical protein [Chitinophagaceae bacterium]
MASKNLDSKIDDEIHGIELISFSLPTSGVYINRLKETAGLYTDILAKPLIFRKTKMMMLDREKLNNPKTEAERKEIWRKRLKYLHWISTIWRLKQERRIKILPILNIRQIQPWKENQEMPLENRLTVIFLPR